MLLCYISRSKNYLFLAISVRAHRLPSAASAGSGSVDGGRHRRVEPLRRLGGRTTVDGTTAALRRFNRGPATAAADWVREATICGTTGSSLLRQYFKSYQHLSIELHYHFYSLPKPLCYLDWPVLHQSSGFSCRFGCLVELFFHRRYFVLVLR